MTLALAALVLLLPPVARADRIFYQGGLWLDTSASVQRLSLLRVVRSWADLAARSDGAKLSPRQWKFTSLGRCLGDARHTTDDLLRRITVFSFVQPERVFYSLSDFVGEALRDLCPGAVPPLIPRPRGSRLTLHGAGAAGRGNA